MKFHLTEEKTVISGSIDGIINLFDVTQTTENDALQLSLNTNSSIVSFTENLVLIEYWNICIHCLNIS